MRRISPTTLFMVLIALIAVAVLSVNVGVRRGEPKEALSNAEALPAEGNLAPDFSLSTYDGGTVSLSTYKGRKVVLTFWGLSCPSCKVELPHLDRLASEGEAVVITVVAGDPLSVRGYLQRHPYFRGRRPNFIIALDPSYKVFRAYRVRFTPTNFLIAPDGRIEKVIVGAVPIEHLKAVLSHM